MGVKQKTTALCVTKGCGKIITMTLVQEDEETVQYDGVCVSCGSQYHLILKKEG